MHSVRLQKMPALSPAYRFFVSLMSLLQPPLLMVSIRRVVNRKSSYMTLVEVPSMSLSFPLTTVSSRSWLPLVILTLVARTSIIE